MNGRQTVSPAEERDTQAVGLLIASDLASKVFRAHFSLTLPGLFQLIQL